VEIEAFIEARLSHLEDTVRYNQIRMNGLDVNRQIRDDVRATRLLLKIAAMVEGFAESAPAEVPREDYAHGIRCTIAARWSDHKDFKQEWLFW
jgi:hypothetical protein